MDGMTKFDRIKYTLIIVICLIFNSCKQRQDFSIKGGTTILCLFKKDSIIMAADSRTEHVNSVNIQSPINITYTDTANKVHNLGKCFFEMAGPTYFNNVDIAELVKKSYNKNISIEKNGDFISSYLKLKLDSIYKSFNSNEINYLSSDPYALHLTLFFAGYENENVSFYSIDYFATKIGNYYTCDDPIIVKKPLTEFVVAGQHEKIDKLTNVPQHIKNGFLKCLIWMIAVEARTSASVDSNVNYAVIKPHTFYTGRNY